MKHSLSDQACFFYGSFSEFNSGDLIGILSESEISRAENFLLPTDRERYLISKGILKRLLSQFLEIDEMEIIFDHNKNGKPFLKGNPDLKFSVSHSDDVFVIGLSNEMEIGVDVENLNREVAFTKLQDFLFSPDELAFVQDLDSKAKDEYFIKCWTQKEALLKANGSGLTQEMNQIDLSSIDKSFYLKSCSVLGNYQISVAIKGHVNCCRWIPVHETGLLLNEAG